MGFGDSMRMGDGFQAALECGHPNQKAGSKCELCGKEVPGQPPIEEVGEVKDQSLTQELSDGADAGPLQEK